MEYDVRPESASSDVSTGAIYAQFRDVRPLPSNQELARYFERFGPVSGVFDSGHPQYVSVCVGGYVFFFPFLFQMPRLPGSGL